MNIETTSAAAPPPSAIADPATLDRLIMTSATAEWCKVALLIARVTDACKAEAIDATGQTIAARIYALVEEGRLTVQGNVRRWRACLIQRTSTTGV